MTTINRYKNYAGIVVQWVAQKAYTTTTEKVKQIGNNLSNRPSVIRAKGFVADKYNQAKRFVTSTSTFHKAEQFYNSKMGQFSASLVAETVGLTLGKNHPLIMILMTLGEKACEKAGISYQHNQTMLLGIGLIVFLGLLGVSLETPLPTLNLLLSLAGGTLGSMKGLMTIGKGVPEAKTWNEEYLVKTFQSIVATDMVGRAVRDMIPVVQTWLTGAIGVGFSTVIGMAGYHGQLLGKEIVKACVNPKDDSNYSDPGDFIAAMINASYGNMYSFIREITRDFNFINKVVLRYSLNKIADKKLITNTLVRSMNFYMQILRFEDVQNAMKKLSLCPPEQKEKQRHELRKLIRKKIVKELNLSSYEKSLTQTIRNRTVAPRFAKGAQAIVKNLQKMEKELTGFTISDERSEDLLHIHFLSFSLVALVKLNRSFSYKGSIVTESLDPTEIRDFYTQLSLSGFSQYQDFKVVKVAKFISSLVIPIIIHFRAQISRVAVKGLTGKIQGDNTTEPRIVEIPDAIFNEEEIDPEIAFQKLELLKMTEEVQKKKKNVFAQLIGVLTKIIQAIGLFFTNLRGVEKTTESLGAYASYEDCKKRYKYFEDLTPEFREGTLKEFYANRRKV